MKNKYISPIQIPHLVRLTADLFNTLNKEVQAMHTSPQKAIQVNFVVDLLKDFTDTAYPIKEPNYNSLNDAMDAFMYSLNLKPNKEAVLKDIEKDFQNIAKMMKDYKPPKAPEGPPCRKLGEF